MKNLPDFSKVKILVVGDAMLDRYWWGDVSRISPEAPVPVVSLKKTSVAAGGAANVAANVAGLGATPYLVAVTGDDAEARFFPDILTNVNVRSDFLIPLKNRRTTVKTRIVAHNQHVVRIDQEDAQALSGDEINLVLEKIGQILEAVDAVIISDYAKGLLTEDFTKHLIIQANKKSKKVLVDPKGKNYSKYKGATLLTPNRREAAEACNLEETESNLIERSGKILLENLAAEAVLITQGENGMELFRKNEKSRHLSALARKVYDVTGAGDTVIASLAVAAASGADWYQAADIANIAAGLVVEQLGTTSITEAKLKHAFNSRFSAAS